MIDSHAHLDSARYDDDRDAMLTRAYEAGVRGILSIGIGDGPATMHRAADLARDCANRPNTPRIWASAGIHPHEAQGAKARHFDLLRQAADEPKVLAIGEIGLDYFYDHSPREIQQQVLIQQLQIAAEKKLPVIIHCRDAWADLEEIIGRHWAGSGRCGILHCFTGTREEAFQFMDWGFMISFAGNVTFKKAEGLREVAREIPLDRLLTETDSPYLAPVPNRGKRNEPVFVLDVVRQLAVLRGMSPEEMGTLTGRNFMHFFGLA